MTALQGDVDRVYDRFVDRWHGYIDIKVHPRTATGYRSADEDIAELREVITIVIDAYEEPTP